ncbi:hypothetical protein [Desulfonatronum thiodismutans]|uniref:hypothetical protein n=1 Tax=Desulfonatronum thiodismutans TaxID=159290 RepID=UPI0004ABD903|nr:hypothetical protein [Desulfonatronum thiodismutans]
MHNDVFSDLANRWPSAVVARSQIEAFTGGAIKGSYMANLDAAGEGPPREKIGRQKWVYPVRPLVDWLRHRSQASGK